MEIKNTISFLMLILSLPFITACSDDDDDSIFRYEPTSSLIAESHVSWVTPNSVVIKAGLNSCILLSSEKSHLENIENAYTIAYGNESYAVVYSDYFDNDHKGTLFYGLKPNTTYYYVVLRYDSIRKYYYYGNICSFTTDEPITEIVDLGLSVKWRGWNLDAKNPYDRGYGYMWGYTSPGYIKNPIYPNESNITGTEYDAANFQLGSNWRMPTIAECEELKSKCTFQKVTCYDEENQVARDGIYITGPSGKHLFIPSTWTLSVNDHYELDYFNTCCFWIGESGVSEKYRYYFSGYYDYNDSYGKIQVCNRNWALPIRAVTE